MNLLARLIDRLDTAERLRKASLPQTLDYSGLLFTIPIFFTSAFFLIKYDRNLLDSASMLTLWFAFVVVVPIFVFGSMAWQTRVPIKIQAGAAAIAWLVLIWMFFHCKFWELHGAVR